jgi:hypothetical protein
MPSWWLVLYWISGPKINTILAKTFINSTLSVSCRVFYLAENCQDFVAGLFSPIDFSWIGGNYHLCAINSVTDVSFVHVWCTGVTRGVHKVQATPYDRFVTNIKMTKILVILRLYWNPMTLVLIWKVLRQAFRWYHYFWYPSTFGWVLSLFEIFSKYLQSY